MSFDARPRWSLRARALCAALALLGAALGVGTGAHVSAAPVPEEQLKAAFVFNFAVFTEWPQEALGAGAPIVLCAAPNNALLPALSQLNDKLVNGHRIALREIGASARACHVLVLGQLDREHWGKIRRELAGATVLTVSDDRAISADGVVIALSVEHARVGFDVDMSAARGARLNLSSKLLRLARSVQ
ncbi:MAG: YfiR family protein [Pseudomonadota bacterium]